MIGWSPFTAMKKLSKKVVKSGPLKLAAEAILPGSGLLALGVQHKKKLAKVAKPVGKFLMNKKVLNVGKAIAGGISVVCPAIGVPALAALTVAGKVQASLKSANDAIRSSAQRIVRNTAIQAIKQRDPAAIRALGMMAFYAHLNAQRKRAA